MQKHAERCRIAREETLIWNAEEGRYEPGRKLPSIQPLIKAGKITGKVLGGAAVLSAYLVYDIGRLSLAVIAEGLRAIHQAYLAERRRQKIQARIDKARAEWQADADKVIVNASRQTSVGYGQTIVFKIYVNTDKRQ